MQKPHSFWFSWHHGHVRWYGFIYSGTSLKRPPFMVVLNARWSLMRGWPCTMLWLPVFIYKTTRMVVVLNERWSLMRGKLIQFVETVSPKWGNLCIFSGWTFPRSYQNHRNFIILLAKFLQRSCLFSLHLSFLKFATGTKTGEMHRAPL